MFSTLRTRFGIPGVISVIALVFAMLGGAYAASSNTHGQATASAKAKAGPRGPKGPKGATGPAGAQGPAGAAGPKGDTGAAGANGTNGANGSDGQSVTSSVAPPEPAHCANGGSKFVSVSGTTYACNGATGAKGSTGSPWTAGGTLPTGATETGVWGTADYPAPFENSAGPEGRSNYSFSFSIPLASAPEVIFMNREEGETSAPGCPGIIDEVPTAEPGKLCLYTEGFESAEVFSISAGKAGGYITVKCLEKFCSSLGPWAVTGA